MLKLRSNLFTYIFAFVVLIIVIITVVFFMNDKKKESESAPVDQISTVNNIQKDIRISITDFDTINPIISNNRNVHEVSKLIYNSLVSLDENYKLKYDLATEISKTESNKYLVKLRQGIEWQDWTKFTAKDVKFTIDMIKSDASNSIYKQNLRNVVELAIIDEYTFTITLSEEEELFEYNLTFPIMCSSFYEGEDFFNTAKNDNPVGTGMFKITSIDEKSITLTPSNVYFEENKKPVIEKIQILKFQTIGEAYEAFKMGNIDILNVKNSNVQEYIGTIGYTKIDYKEREYNCLALNVQDDLLSRLEVRQAINLGIDKNNLIASSYGEKYTTTDFMLDYGSFLYSGNNNIDYNPDEAEGILEDSRLDIKEWYMANNRRTSYKKIVFLTISKFR